MAELHGKDTVLLGDEFALTGYLTSANTTKETETADVTTFGDDDRNYIAGLTMGSISLEGVFDNASNASDEELHDALGAASGKLISVGYGGLTVANRVSLLQARETNYTIDAAVDDAVRVTATFTGDGAVMSGVSLHDLTAETGTVDESSVDNGGSTANGFVAQLHVTAFSGTDCTIVIEDSTDDAAFANLGSFTSVTGVTQERITGTGTVNQYVRAAITGGTFSSVTFAVTFARLLR